VRRLLSTTVIAVFALVPGLQAASCQSHFVEAWLPAINSRIDFFNKEFQDSEKQGFATELIDLVSTEEKRARSLRNELDQSSIKLDKSYKLSPRLRSVLQSLAKDELTVSSNPELNFLILAHYLRSMLSRVNFETESLSSVLIKLGQLFSYHSEGAPLWQGFQDVTFKAYADVFSRHHTLLGPEILFNIESALDLDHALYSIPNQRNVIIDGDRASVRDLSGDLATSALYMVVNHPHYFEYQKKNFYKMKIGSLFFVRKGMMITLRNSVKRMDGLSYQAGDNCIVLVESRIKVLATLLIGQPEPIYKLQVTHAGLNGHTNESCPVGSEFSLSKEDLMELGIGFGSPLQHDDLL